MSDPVQDKNDLTNTPPSDGTLVMQSPPVKEQKEILAPLESGNAAVVEVIEPEPAKEVEGWIEKLEKAEDVKLPQPVKDDYGQILVDSAAPIKPKIVLPLDDKQITFGLAQKVAQSIRWLAQWCLRLIKMHPERVEYKKKISNS